MSIRILKESLLWLDHIQTPTNVLELAQKDEKIILLGQCGLRSELVGLYFKSICHVFVIIGQPAKTGLLCLEKERE